MTTIQVTKSITGHKLAGVGLFIDGDAVVSNKSKLSISPLL